MNSGEARGAGVLPCGTNVLWLKTGELVYPASAVSNCTLFTVYAVLCYCSLYCYAWSIEAASTCCTAQVDSTSVHNAMRLT
jgi:hypothetical protein